MKTTFTIITSTLDRDSLSEACESVNNQDYENWQHIVVFDKDEYEIDKKRLKQLAHPNREFYYTGFQHNDYGNFGKFFAYDFIEGDYVLYLDDDNIYINETMKTLDGEIVARGTVPDWGIFPMEYFGKRFFNIPPAIYRTDGGQIFHKPVIEGQEIRWTNSIRPCEDGYLVERLKTIAPYSTMHTDLDLFKMEKSGRGVG